MVAAVNDEATLARNLLASAILRDGHVPFHGYRDCHSAAEAYNRGLDETDAEIVVFAHQDVYLPSNWELAVRRAVGALAQIDPDWAVIGAVGTKADGSVVGRSWSSGLGRMIGEPFLDLASIVCVDEMLIVLRRGSGLRFDEGLPGFHLYGSDIVLTARATNLGSYVANIPAVHNSKPVRGLGGAYTNAYRYMCRKWAALLPVPTLIVPLSKGFWPLFRVRLKLAWSLRARARRSVDPSSDPKELAKAIGLE